MYSELDIAVKRITYISKLINGETINYSSIKIKMYAPLSIRMYIIVCIYDKNHICDGKMYCPECLLREKGTHLSTRCRDPRRPRSQPCAPHRSYACIAQEWACQSNPGHPYPQTWGRATTRCIRRSWHK